MNKLKKDLETILKGLSRLSLKLEKFQELIDEEPKTAKKVKAKAMKRLPKKRVIVRKVAPPTAADKVYAIIKRSKKGFSTSNLMKRTGYERKAISNVIYKLTKQGKIKTVAEVFM